MGFERKLIRDAKFKQARLDKTKGRRGALNRERQIADQCGLARRNDLLPELQVRQMPIEQLRPAPRRLRKVDPDHVDRLVSSIFDLGFTLPILVRNGVIIDGHVRFVAARKLELPTVPVIDCSHLDSAQARKLALAANRLAELGEWDIDQLRIEMLELIDLDIDLGATGFSLQEQDIILLDPLGEEAGGSEAEPPSLPDNPTSQSGDIWVLNAHRVICGNALQACTYYAVLEDKQAHLVLTDPPYNVDIRGNVSGLGKKVHDEFVMASGEMDDAQWQAFLDTVLTHLTEQVLAGSVLFVFMDWRSIHRLIEAGLGCGLSQYNLVVWHKQSGGMGAGYRSAHELVAVFCKGEHPRTNNILLGKHGRNRTNVWSFPGANRSGSSANEMLHLHATPKPVELCVDAILDFTERGEVVLDAFLGSGTTLVAAEKSGRICRGIELDPGFVDVSVLRWQRLTGDEALLAATGETFAEVAARRAAGAEVAARSAAGAAADAGVESDLSGTEGGGQSQ